MTAKAIDSEGWFNTGDLGWVTLEDDLVVTGRAKIRLLMGKISSLNRLKMPVRSSYIDQIMLVGQDQRSLRPDRPQFGSSATVGRCPEPLPNGGRGEELRKIKMLPKKLIESKIVQNLFRQN